MKNKHSILWLISFAAFIVFAISSMLLPMSNKALAQNQQDGRGVGTRRSDSGPKVALVIGNADYSNDIGKLKNPVNDATDVASALQRLGFNLVGGKVHLNLNKRQMLERIREFGRSIQKGGVGVFYYAGHGIQVDKHNYLIPITDLLQYQEDAEYEAVDADSVLKEMEFAENAVNILILDACRNSNLPKRPIKRATTEKGLAEPQRKPSGVYIAFAARDGQIASENPAGRNGLYTQELLKNLETPNLRLEDIFINTRREVKRLSNRTQEPIEYGSLDDIFYFKFEQTEKANNDLSNSTSPITTKIQGDSQKNKNIFPKRNISFKLFDTYGACIPGRIVLKNIDSEVEYFSLSDCKKVSFKGVEIGSYIMAQAGFRAQIQIISTTNSDLKITMESYKWQASDWERWNKEFDRLGIPYN